MRDPNKKSILIIEDNLDIIELYTLYFTKAGYEVHTSTDGLMGLVDIMNLKPSIILLDIMMPQMDGYEVLESIADHSDLQIPVVIASNLGENQDKEKALKLGAKLFITKADHEAQEIVEMVTGVLEA
ncbi:response regulator [Candidatus Gracilibacteria bacterium]|nr:response regulator [Candidatus Gracilibacteria bacterium]